MSDKELAEQLKYNSPKEILVVTWDNRLITLKCPFKVLVLGDIGVLKKGLKVFVTEVKVTREIKTVYIIEDNAYFYYHFDIVIP